MRTTVQPVNGSTVDLRKPLVISVILVAYSNVWAAVAWVNNWSAELTFRSINPIFLLLLVPYTAKQPGGLKGVGLRKEGLLASVAWGVPVGLVIAAIAIFFLANPMIASEPVDYPPITGMSQEELLLDLLIRVPVSIAFFEELAFRGLLYRMLRSKLVAWKTIAISSAVFGLWHVGVTIISAHDSGMRSTLPEFLQGLFLPLSGLVGAILTGLAGVAFAWVREHTGNLAGPIVAHWLTDGLIIAALWFKAHGWI